MTVIIQTLVLFYSFGGIVSVCLFSVMPERSKILC